MPPPPCVKLKGIFENKTMKKNPNPLGSTRRSFMKKSVVAAVAASNVTIFSGLVDAAEEEASGGKKCTLSYVNVRTESILVFDDGEGTKTWQSMSVHDCVAGSCVGTIGCSVYYRTDENGKIIRLQDGRIIWYPVTAKCIVGGADPSDYVTCLVNSLPSS